MPKIQVILKLILGEMFITVKGGFNEEQKREQDRRLPYKQQYDPAVGHVARYDRHTGALKMVVPQMISSRSDPWINDHNMFLTIVNNGNTDFKVVFNPGQIIIAPLAASSTQSYKHISIWNLTYTHIYTHTC